MTADANKGRGISRSADVAVALCTYNGAQYVGAQLASVVAQSVLPAQIVVCDDNSADATLDVVRQMLEQAAEAGIECTVVKNAATLGYTKNFEKAIALCSAPFVFLCDQDDIWLGDKIESLLPSLRSSRASFVFSDGEVVDEKATVRGGLFEIRGITDGELEAIGAGRGLRLFLRKRYVTGATSAVKSEFARLCMPFPEAEWSHDEWMALWAAAAGTLIPVSKKTILYRQHGANQFGAPFNTIARLRVHWNRLLQSFARSHSVRLEEKARPLRAALASALPAQLGIAEENVRLLDGYAGWLEGRSAACTSFDLGKMSRQSRNPFVDSDRGRTFAFLLDVIEAISFRLRRGAGG